MKPVAHQYYAKLAGGWYLSGVEKLVPKYDEMTQLIIDLIRKNSPSSLLDIGPGIGHLDHLILTELPEVRITAVEASREMYQVCQKTLDPHHGRVRLLHQDIVEFEPNEKYDAIFSNLVLHNVPYDDKESLLKRLHCWLEPGGIFIWGDMICFADSEIHEYFVQFRLEVALERGVTRELAQENFEKERHHDYPLTIKETFQLGQRAGFSAVENIWIHDTFSIFFMRL
jgi:cyclopropane fatty-acyl-phospholipid synthase-like methyltransferase